MRAGKICYFFMNKITRLRIIWKFCRMKSDAVLSNRKPLLKCQKPKETKRQPVHRISPEC